MFLFIYKLSNKFNWNSSVSLTEAWKYPKEIVVENQINSDLESLHLVYSFPLSKRI